MTDAIMRDIIASMVIEVYLLLLALKMPVDPTLGNLAMIAFGYFFKGANTGWSTPGIFSQAPKIAAVLLVFLLLGASTSKADVFNPIGTNVKYKTFLNSVNGTSINGNLLSDLTQVVNYLGVKEGQAYNFELKKWVTTSSATIITYAPWGLAVDADLINTDGGGGSIDWNVGQYLPVQDVPVIQYTQYLSLFGGAGAENNANGDVKFVSYVGAQFKLTFGS